MPGPSRSVASTTNGLTAIYLMARRFRAKLSTITARSGEGGCRKTEGKRQPAKIFPLVAAPSLPKRDWDQRRLFGFWILHTADIRFQANHTFVCGQRRSPWTSMATQRNRRKSQENGSDVSITIKFRALISISKSKIFYNSAETVIIKASITFRIEYGITKALPFPYIYLIDLDNSLEVVVSYIPNKKTKITPWKILTSINRKHLVRDWRRSIFAGDNTMLNF